LTDVCARLGSGDQRSGILVALFLAQIVLSGRKTFEFFAYSGQNPIAHFSKFAIPLHFRGFGDLRINWYL
jgi:hypothetical protein